MMLVASGMFSMFFFASLYVQEVLGYSPLKAGLAFLPVTAGMMLGAGRRAGGDPPLRAARGRRRRRARSPRSACSG